VGVSRRAFAQKGGIPARRQRHPTKTACFEITLSFLFPYPPSATLHNVAGPSPTEALKPPEAFGTTHWSLVLHAGGLHSEPAAQAWETLARAYWSPLYGYARRRGYAHHQAEDLVQAFFTRLLEKNVLREASQARGRFRTFLLTSLQNFLANEFDRATALKRGGTQEQISIDDLASELPASEAEQAKSFDRAWAEAVLGHALRRLEQEFSTDRKLDQFRALKPFLFRLPAAGEYQIVASQLGIRAPLMATAVSRFRQRLRQLVRAEIAHTVAGLPEVDDEMRYLLSLLA
jgi:RNA polymerase sigma factor (sigma-70 family)